MKNTLRVTIIYCLLCLANPAFAYSNNPYHTVRSKPAQQFRIASYNISDNTDYPVTAPMETVKAIIKVNADIIFMQESIPAWSHYFDKHLANLYPYRYSKPYPHGGGLIILAKNPIKTIRYIHSHIGWFPAWYIEANTAIGPLQMINVHLTPPLVAPNQVGMFLRGVFSTPGVRKREMAYYASLLQPGKPAVIAGDFNEGDFGLAAKYLRNDGYVDGLPHFHITTNTWFLHISQLTFADRYDHIFYSPGLVATNVQVLKEGNSDHYPVYTDLKRTR